ncbi:hypothetical protein IQ07DRAFT_66068 [Pyrenochaeta sp. DS3sAY3a]|nr:hypothetical protein IQ07DRAFT_66068 [Pyrenochaeta sp. DS3sAY3a]
MAIMGLRIETILYVKVEWVLERSRWAMQLEVLTKVLQSQARRSWRLVLRADASCWKRAGDEGSSQAGWQTTASGEDKTKGLNTGTDKTGSRGCGRGGFFCSERGSDGTGALAEGGLGGE